MESGSDCNERWRVAVIVMRERVAVTVMRESDSDSNERGMHH